MMAGQIDNRAPVGSLFKQPRLEKRHKRMRSERVHDDKHLALVRKCMCMVCGMDPAGEAAHVRISSAAHSKPNTGSRKPDDKWTLPLCHECHMRQHSEGELTFWYRIGLSAVHWCQELFRVTGDLDAMRATVMRSYRERTPAD